MATITATAGGYTSSVDIRVGVTGPPDQMYVNGVSYENYDQNVCVDQGIFYDVAVTPVPGAISYTWYIDALPSDVTLNYGQGTNLINVTINGNVNNSLIFAVRPENACGLGPTYQIAGSICGSSIPPRYSVSPNPTTGYIKIEVIDKTAVFNEVQVVDRTGNVRRQIKIGHNVQKHQINIGDLPSDVYIIRIYDGKSWTIKKIVKN